MTTSIILVAGRVLTVALAFTFASVRAEAAVLVGQVTGFSVLNCIAANTTGRPQVVDQVQYQWACNYGPMNPYQMNFRSEPCFGGCMLGPGETFFHNPGVFTGNCPAVVTSYCRVFTH